MVSLTYSRNGGDSEMRGRGLKPQGPLSLGLDATVRPYMMGHTVTPGIKGNIIGSSIPKGLGWL